MNQELRPTATSMRHPCMHAWCLQILEPAQMTVVVTMLTNNHSSTIRIMCYVLYRVL
jgi:hypothetical protein